MPAITGQPIRLPLRQDGLQARSYNEIMSTQTEKLWDMRTSMSADDYRLRFEEHADDYRNRFTENRGVKQIKQFEEYIAKYRKDDRRRVLVPKQSFCKKREPARVPEDTPAKSIHHNWSSPSLLQHAGSNPVRYPKATSRQQLQQQIKWQKFLEREAKLRTKEQQNPLRLEPHQTNFDIPPIFISDKPLLENPTKYHVAESTKKNNKFFLMEPDEEVSAFHGLYSVPEEPTEIPTPVFTLSPESVDSPEQNNATIDYKTNLPPDIQNLSLAPTSAPSNSLSQFTNISPVPSDHSEIDESLVQEILSLDNEYKPPENNNNALNKQSTLTPFNEFVNFENCSDRPDVTIPEITIKNEHPPFEGKFDAVLKDRKKKDTHNKIERQRRDHINIMIKELSRLLPQNGEQFFEKLCTKRQYKGHILSAAVDYIRIMKNEVILSNKREEKNKALEEQNKQLQLRIQELENLLRQNQIEFEERQIECELSGILSSDVISSTTSTSTANTPVFMNSQLEERQDVVDSTDFFNIDTYGEFDQMEEDKNPYCNDVMLTPPSSHQYDVDDLLKMPSLNS